MQEAGQDGTRTALIIGGGIAGPVAVMALHEVGIRATVHEDGHCGNSQPTASGVGWRPRPTASTRWPSSEPTRSCGDRHADDRHGHQSWAGKQLAEFGTLPGLPNMQFV